jgi:streptomycin 6-kinase
MTGTESDAVDLIPSALADRIRAYHSAGAAWLAELPDLIASCATRWGLTLLPAFEPGGDASWTAPVRRSTGEPAVLQITVPMPVRHDHVTALRAWAGRGAVKVFAHDAAIRATLMELCAPGTDAAEMSSAEADDVAADILPQLWAADLPNSMHPDSLVTNAAGRAQLMGARADQFGEVIDAGPFHEASRLFTSLPVTAARAVLLHGDFHRRNVLLSERGWLAVDPCSMVGDPAFDVARFLMNDMNDPATAVRADALADRLGLDRDRTRAWLFALATQAGSWFLSIGDKTTHDAYKHATSTLL